jgi:putative salt-induced outer membrane protein YdiY
MIRARSFFFAAVPLVALPVFAQAQDAGFSWSNATEVSYVSTSGNASSSTLGLKGTLEGSGGANEFKFEVGGVRASSDLTTRIAVGTVDDFDIFEDVRSEKTAESYFARGRYDRSFGAGFAFAGAGWDRNTFAGIQNRTQFMSGLGRTFVEGDNGRFKADAGLTYTMQKDVDPVPGAKEGFGGWRVSLDAVRRISQTSDFRSELVVNNSFEDTSDVRADWVNSLSVSINSALALKTSLQLLWDNVPAQIGVPLETTGGAPTGTNVLTPSEGLDTVLTLALVIRL